MYQRTSLHKYKEQYMGRRKKNNTANNIKIFFIGIILTALVACGVYLGLQYWTPGDEIIDIPGKKEVQVPPEEVPTPPEQKPLRSDGHRPLMLHADFSLSLPL